MKEIKLTRGFVTIIDDEDYERVSSHKWYALVGQRSVYATRHVQLPNGRRAALGLHRFILGITDKGLEVDHVNRNGLDNRRANLRACTRSQNQANRGPQRNNKCGIKGVSFHPRGRWAADIQLNGVTKHLGQFDTKEQAAEAYANAAKQYFGSFCATS